MATKSVYIYGEIWDDGVNETYVQGVLNEMQEGDELEVVINSPGGSVFTGLGIYNLVKAYNPVVKIIGLAASMASVIACAGREVQMADNAMFMIHNPWTYAWAGDENYFKKVAENLGKVKAQILKAYVAKTGLNDDKLIALMNEETWLDAKESQKLGFCNSIFTPGKEEAKALYLNASSLFAASLRKINDINNNGVDMEIKDAMNKIAALEASVQAIEAAAKLGEQKLADAETQIQALTTENLETKAALIEREAELQELKGTHQELKADAERNEELMFCEKLVAENKLKRDDVDKKVAKLLALRNNPVMMGDVTLYDLERQEMESHQPIIGSMDTPPPATIEPEDDLELQRKEIEKFNANNKLR